MVDYTPSSLGPNSPLITKAQHVGILTFYRKGGEEIRFELKTTCSNTMIKYH